MSTRTRLMAGFGAAASGPFITALIQLVSVSAFLRAWGPQLYGEWLILSAVPSYLSMTDMGFGSVAGNDMTMRVAVSDRDGALETFQSTWLLVTLISLAVAAIASGMIVAAPVTAWLRITSIGPREARLVLALLSVYALVTLQASILAAAFRADGLYALGLTGINAMRLIENIGMLVALAFHGEPIHVALAGATIRCAGTGLLYSLLRYKLNWVRLGFAHATWRRLQELTPPAIAFMAFPVGNALSIQGMTIVVGLVLGPVAVATFNPMRTLSRFAFQILEQIKHAVWPELSSAYGAQNWPLARKLHRFCCQIAFWVATLAVIALAIAGPIIFRIWTRHRVVMNIPCFYILLVVVVASSLWNTSSIVSIAANAHHWLAVQYLCGTAASLVLAYLLLPHLQMIGAALALLASDIWMGFFVIRDSNNLLSDDTADFIRSMFSFNRLKLLVVG